MSPPGTADFQISAPFRLLSATIVASLPPGTHTTTSPSTRGDSAYAHVGASPPKSVRRDFCQRTLPVAASRQARSPSDPRAYSTAPSTVGVDRAAGKLGCWLGLPTTPIRVDQIFFPSFTSRALTNSSSSPWLLIRYIRPPATDGVAYPLPRSLTCHRSLGPSLGHSLRRPFSLECPSRFGPRNWGQSAVHALAVRNKHTETETRIFQRIVLRMGHPPGQNRWPADDHLRRETAPRGRATQNQSPCVSVRG